MWEWIKSKIEWPKKVLALLTKDYPGKPYVLFALASVAAALTAIKLLGGWECAILTLVACIILGIVIKIAFKPSRADKHRATVLGWFAVVVFIFMTGWGAVQLIRFDARPATPATQEMATRLRAVSEPMGPGDYPSVSEIWDLPSKEQVEQHPALAPEKVVFSYKNATGIPLRLILFNCYYHYFPLENEPIAPQDAWRSWELPATNKFYFFSKFGNNNTGWYVFFVMRPDTRERFQLETKNIFYSDWPAMTIRATGDKKKPFVAEFTSVGKDDAP